VALRIVLDTNVIVSALRSSRGASFQILDAVLSQRLELLVSVKLAFEYEEVLKRESEALGLHNVDVDRLVQRLCDIGIKIPTGFRSTPILNDPDDEMLVDLAISGGAAHIVTHNVHHLAPATQLGISVIRPADLLRIRW
jgi:putative PIN family toxin of toxin-antitoxin system